MTIASTRGLPILQIFHRASLVLQLEVWESTGEQMDLVSLEYLLQIFQTAVLRTRACVQGLDIDVIQTISVYWQSVQIPNGGRT